MVELRLQILEMRGFRDISPERIEICSIRFHHSIQRIELYLEVRWNTWNTSWGESRVELPLKILEMRGFWDIIPEPIEICSVQFHHSIQLIELYLEVRWNTWNTSWGESRVELPLKILEMRGFCD